MKPEVVQAIDVLREKAILTDAEAREILPPARGELVSVRRELRALLYAGVLLCVSGVGLFLKENHDRIGPAAIASLLGAAAAANFLFVFRRSPPFSWGASPSPHVAADYLLLLGVLLAGSDLAYVETQFRLLGADWAYHLLVLSAIALAAAYRFDSRVVLSLALSSFAAWLGLSTRLPFESLFQNRSGEFRANAVLCASLFLAAAVASARTEKKAHFEALYAAFGWLLLFGGLLSGVFTDDAHWLPWDAAAGLAAAAVVVFAYRRSRLFDFAIAVVAAYLTLLKPLEKATGGDTQTFFLVAALSSLGILVLLTAAYRRMRARS